MGVPAFWTSVLQSVAARFERHAPLSPPGGRAPEVLSLLERKAVLRAAQDRAKGAGALPSIWAAISECV